MAKVRLIRSGLAMEMRIAPFGDDPDAPVLTGRYIPMTREDRDDYIEAQNGLKAARKLDLLAEQIGKRVLSWDVEGADPRKPDDVKAVPPVFLDRIETHLTGYTMSPQGRADEGKSESPTS